MKKILIALAATTMLTGVVSAQSISERTGVNSVLGVAPSTADFVKEVATSDMLEIEAAKIAQRKGNDAEKKFAERVIADHTQTSNDLKGMVKSGDLKAELPTALDSSAQSKLDKLRVATPQEFAALYDPMQVDAHEDAVSLFERYSKSGDNANLKNWAGKTLETLKSHLVMAIKMNEDRHSTVGSSKTAPTPMRMDRK
jgi:putative membrane protein